MRVEIPRLRVSEYHRPYVAIWIEDGRRQFVSDLKVWYQRGNTADQAGTKWLPDLRQWWRKSGRRIDVPVDGMTAATRPVGTHALKFDEDHPAIAALKPGEYVLVVEAAREVGGRELVRIPFQWPAGEVVSKSLEGKEELGSIELTIQP